MFDITVVGTATEDMFVNVPSAGLITVSDPDQDQTYLALDYGAKLPVSSIFVSVGGASTNTAAGLARLGMRTAAFAKLGQDDAGDRVVARLQGLGIDTSHFVRTTEFGTGYSVILTGYTGDRTILTYRGASAEMTEADVPWEFLAQSPWMFLGSMSGPSAPLFVKLADFAGAHGVKLAINPGAMQVKLGCEGLKPALEHCAALFLNKEEACGLTGVCPRRDDRDEQEIVERLHETGCRHVFITDGARGVYGSAGAELCHLPAYKAKVVSTVGAGDAFAAGALTALARGADVPRALRVGSLNAAAVVQGFGANETLLDWETANRWADECEPGHPCPPLAGAAEKAPPRSD
ncbi:MAG TPA: carbohydrate kinase family protein [Armatimonadota bacterium]|jgi:ribokinase